MSFNMVGCSSRAPLFFAVTMAILTATQARERDYWVPGFVRAICLIEFGTASGNIVFRQRDVEGSETWITGVVKGLNASAMHGWHVHEKQVNETEGCGSTGGHFNPFGTVHGAPENPPDRRHVGDLGNFRTDTKGVGVVKVADSLISLVGNNSVIGRGLVIHGGQDDLGRGGDEGSMANGNAGPRVGCCTITQVL